MNQRGARLVFPSPTFNAESSLEAGDRTTPGQVTRVNFAPGLKNCNKDCRIQYDLSVHPHVKL